MNTPPWNIIGWIILTAFAARLFYRVFILSIKAFPYLWSCFSCWRLHIRSRNIPPQKGQAWQQLGSKENLYVTNITENGRIILKSGCASWGESQEDWNTRVKNRKMFLVHD